MNRAWGLANALSAPACRQIVARRGARKLLRAKNYEPLPEGIAIHRERAASVGVLLRRDPVILPEPEPFEAAYAAHAEALRAEVARPMASAFFFKKGTDDEKLFQEAQALAAGGGPSGAAAASASDSEASAAPALPGSGPENPFLPYNGPLAPRHTEADAANDVTSLNRALDRPLFLVVRNRDEPQGWKLPDNPVGRTELLHEAAQRFMKEDYADLDTWVVGRVPIGFYTYLFREDDKASRALFRNLGANVFYMKAHVMSGQIQQLKDRAKEWAWVTKEELKEMTAPDYYEAIKDML
ncbi:hypothetical protein DFJ74DRAFT_753877 [Hyaloraphidium curvatum]|nr:hypothetical protein DFJ74DRAFT_753877 [Hyaloraphidium curvatum]